MNDKYLIDTDVIIDYLRSNPQAIDFLENCNNELLISAITVAEIYSGIRNEKERINIDSFLTVFKFIPIDLDISKKGGLVRAEFGKVYGIGFGDSLIAATSIITKSKLVTLNYKHFKMLDNLLIPYKKD